MDEKMIEVVARAVKFANLSDPNPQSGTTTPLDVAIPGLNPRSFAVAIVESLEKAGYKIVEKDV